MSISRKLSATGVLLLAIVSLAAAIVRLNVQREIITGGYAAHADVDLTLTTLLYWSMLESGLALIASCLPIIQQLLRHTDFRSALSSARIRASFDNLRSRSKSSAYSGSTNPGPAGLYTNIGDTNPSKDNVGYPRDKYEREYHQRSNSVQLRSWGSHV